MKNMFIVIFLLNLVFQSNAENEFFNDNDFEIIEDQNGIHNIKKMKNSGPKTVKNGYVHSSRSMISSTKSKPSSCKKKPVSQDNSKLEKLIQENIKTLNKLAEHVKKLSCKLEKLEERLDKYEEDE